MFSHSSHIYQPRVQFQVDEALFAARDAAILKIYEGQGFCSKAETVELKSWATMQANEVDFSRKKKKKTTSDEAGAEKRRPALVHSDSQTSNQNIFHPLFKSFRSWYKSGLAIKYAIQNGTFK